MAISVHVPVRIRLDARSVTERPAAVTDALGAALARALERSRREVVAPRGGYLEVRPNPPEFRWTGAGGERVSPDDRRAFEARLRRRIDEVITAARLDPGLPAGVAAPLSRPAAEVFDPQRMRHLLAVYRVPSYDDGGGAAEVPVDGDEPPSVTYQWLLRPVTYLASHFAELGREAVRQHGGLPSGTPQGVIARVVGSDGRPVWVVMVNTTPWSVLTFERFGETVFRAAPQPHFEVEERVPSPQPGTVQRRLVADRSALVAMVDEELSADIRQRLRTAQPRGETTSVDEYQAQIERAVDAEVTRRVDAILASVGGAVPTCLVVISIGGVSLLLVGTEETDKTLHWTGTANLLPISAEQRPAAPPDPNAPPGGGIGDGTGSGTGTGSGSGVGGATGAGGGTGAGTGSGPGDPTGSGTGPGGGGTGGDGSGGARRGGFVFDPSSPSAPPGAEGRRFPAVTGEHSEMRACAPFHGEPELAALGPDGDELRRLMDDIAFRLQMGEACRYPANFCLQAAAMLRGRAAAISLLVGASEREAFTRPVPQGSGGLGPLDFRPVASPAVQFLRHLAGVVPRLDHLAQLVMRRYSQPEHFARVQGGWIDTSASWNLHFVQALSGAIKDAVGQLFVVGSQAMLVQLLLSSRTGIEARITHFDQYAPIFERLIVSQLTDYAELQGLRERLRRHEAARWTAEHTDVGGGTLATVSMANPSTAWYGAARAISSAFLATEAALSSPGAAGEIVERDSTTRIRDSHAVLWTLAEIEQALVIQRGEAEGIDPLVKQITDLPDVLARFAGNRSAIRDELWRVLQDMRRNNTEMLGRARTDARFAFRSSRISEHIPSATIPGGQFALQGIHLVTHQQIGEFFGGNLYYATGVDSLFHTELGREALSAFGVMVGIIALSLLCPPLGFVVGVAVAAVDVAHAHQRERLYGSMLDPELVLTRTEVEVELFAAYLGLALSLIPEAGTIGGAAVRGGRVALRFGVRAGLRTARGYVVRRVTRQIIEAASRDLLQGFLTEILLNEVLERVVQKLMEPVLAYVEREAMLSGAVGGPEGARFILMVLDSQPGGAAAGPRVPVVRP
ncbi:hypothetical protein [Micromonospora zamorensis]|uniref:hypothetical protein n=1 Tax=Micromonospora zamorensis TaxID=709883 RepID=UPI00081FA11E|nr:hypothetical protein [Micromonospora zamorensis]SCG52986.1 hypothetical protein GA0070619_2843 [Micromonospora zamorensis]